MSQSSIIKKLTRIVIIIMITGFIGFHHSIVGNLEVFGAFLYADNISFADYLIFLAMTLIGNGIGGAIVVGPFKYRVFASNFAPE